MINQNMKKKCLHFWLLLLLFHYLKVAYKGILSLMWKPVFHSVWQKSTKSAKVLLLLQKSGMNFRGQKCLNDFKISANIRFTKKLCSLNQNLISKNKFCKHFSKIFLGNVSTQISAKFELQNCFRIVYTRHHKPLLIRSHS